MNEFLKIEPKSCPFCGWGTIVDGGIIKHYCECNSCHSKGSAHKTWENAVKAWNTRYMAEQMRNNKESEIYEN